MISQKFMDKFIGDTLSIQTKRGFFKTIFYYIVDSKERTQRRVDYHIKRQLENPDETLLTVAHMLRQKTIDETVVEVVNYVTENIKYTRDYKLYKRAEKWADAKDTLRIGKGDCDDMNLLVHVLCVLAGIPEYLLFSCIGNVNPEGHYWVLYFSPRKGRWYTLDSCYYPNKSSISRRPIFKFTDTRYKQIWFMFNSHYVYKQKK